MQVLCCLLLSLLQLSNAVPVRNFYPFGAETTDGKLSPNDDDSSRLQLSATVPFFGTGHNSIFVNNNGLLSFGEAVSTYTPRSFPLDDDHQLIAPYWADVDTRETGIVWFREVNDSALLNTIGSDIRTTIGDSILSFQPTSALIATWDGVGYYSAHSDLTNTFQCVLVSDGSLSFAIFLYADGGIQWTTGDNSGGAGGRGGIPAVAGINAGDRIESATLPGSKTHDIINVAMTSNVKLPGMWVFQVNEEVSQGMCYSEEIFSKGVTYDWPATCSGSSVTFTCPNNPIYSASRECSVEGIWQDFDQDACGVLTEELKNLLTTQLNRETLGEFVAKLSEMVALSINSIVDQNKENFKLIAGIFEKVANFIIQFNVMLGEGEIIANMVETVNSLLKWTPSAIEAASSSRIMTAFEQVVSFYAWQIPENTSQIFNLTSTILVTERLNLEELQSGGRTFSSGGNELTHSSENEVNDTFQLLSEQDGAIHLPASLFESIQYRDNVGIFFAFYDQPTLFPVDNEDDNGAPSQVQVGSPVIASTVGGDNYSIDNLNEPIIVTLKVKKDFVISGSEECVSWDFDLREWTPQGCNTTVSQDGVIICSCNHLTNFAVLVDICLRQEVCGTSQAETALTFISYIGMSASIISLIFALIILLSHKRIRQKTITKYHVQLSLSLLLMLTVSLVLVVLSAENVTSLYGGCVTVSSLVHYFTLVAVMWMGAEALFMFQKLVLVFVEITTKYIIIVSAICWGLPMFFVMVPLLADLADGNDPRKDLVIKRDSYCFLSNPGAFWGTFLIPILLILLFNVVIFIWISIVLIQHAICTASRKKEATNNKNLVQLMISIGGVMFLFGITWLFAILTISVSGLRETFQILFTVFNSFQGFFIFLFFCAINKEARESWKEMFGSGRQSALLHSPYAISNGHSPNGSRMNAFRAQRSATDSSTIRHHDHMMMISKLGESRKESWDSDNSGYKPDVLQAVKIVAAEDSDILLKGIVIEKDEVKPNDEEVGPIPEKQWLNHDLVDSIPVERVPKHDLVDFIPVEQEPNNNLVDSIPVEQGPKHDLVDSIPVEREPKHDLVDSIPVEQEPNNNLVDSIPVEQGPKHDLVDSIPVEREPKNNLVDSIPVEQEPNNNLADSIPVEREPKNNLVDSIPVEREPKHDLVDSIPVEREPKHDLVDSVPVEREPKHDFVDTFSLTSATTESGIDPSDSTSIGEHDQDGSRSPSGVPELDVTADQDSSVGANTERKDSATLKVSIKRYPSQIKREYDVEEIKVEFHSDSSSESSDEDI